MNLKRNNSRFRLIPALREKLPIAAPVAYTLRRIKRIAMPACLLFILSGCTVLTRETVREASCDNLRLTYMETHYRDILAEIGPPAKMCSFGDGMAMLYEDIYINESQFGLTMPYGWLSLFKLSFANAKAHREEMYMIFNEDGLLVNVGSDHRMERIGSGEGLQILFEIADLVDKSAFTQPASQHNWGQGILAPLPEALNENQNLENGENGLQQTATTPHVGQHTLATVSIRED